MCRISGGLSTERPETVSQCRRNVMRSGKVSEADGWMSCGNYRDFLLQDVANEHHFSCGDSAW